jgi:UDP-N-acetylmuramoylalanine--D-glutamate ligase
MITEEHLDWHSDIDEYINAKSNLFSHQTNNDVAIYFAKNEHSAHLAGFSKGLKVPYFAPPGARVSSNNMIVIGDPEKEIISKREVGLIGAHNLQNICAALTAVQEAVGNLDKANVVLSSFSGLEHRLELVRTLGNVNYYDDSFGTTPDTAIVALKALVQPVVMILGGHDKGLDYRDLINEITAKDRVRHVITIGTIGHKLAEMLRQSGFTAITEGLNKMPDIVAEARNKAQPGDAVLLSCGTSSFGLFSDYKDRGEQFKKAVQLLS